MHPLRTRPPHVQVRANSKHRRNRDQLPAHRANTCTSRSRSGSLSAIRPGTSCNIRHASASLVVLLISGNTAAAASRVTDKRKLLSAVGPDDLIWRLRRWQLIEETAYPMFLGLS